MKPESSDTRAAEITACLKPAYENASRLKITKAEAKQLTKPFPDHVIEIRSNDGAIFLPHIFLSQRLNEVFGPGAWSLICREHYHDEEARMIYAEHVLIIRGCFVGEAVGEHSFNALEGEKYGDGLESTAAEALRRICGKRLSCGNQLWQPDFCEKWQKKYAETFAGEISNGREIIKAALWRKKGAKSTLNESETPTPRTKKYQPTEDDKFLMLQCLSSLPKDQVLKFAIEQKIIGFAQELEAWPLDKVVAGEVAIRKLQTQIIGSFPSAKPEPKSWQETEIPFGSMKGKKLGELAKDVLAGYWEAMSTATITGQDDFKKALSDAAKFHHLTKLKQSSKK
jgi:hypothetical protein